MTKKLISWFRLQRSWYLDLDYKEADFFNSYDKESVILDLSKKLISLIYMTKNMLSLIYKTKKKIKGVWLVSAEQLLSCDIIPWGQYRALKKKQKLFTKICK